MRLLFEMFLKPLSALYGAVTMARNCLYDTKVNSEYRSEIPVISVGNLTVGGNGKTPLVVTIAQILISLGRQPAIVMRGYGGTECGPHFVTINDSTAKVGDEALLLAETLSIPVLVSRSRREGLELLREKTNADVVILDDGFQHRAVARDLDIVTHYLGSDSAKSDFLKGRLLPEGKFRENRDRALRRASAIVFSSRSLHRITSDKSIEQKVPSNLPIFYSNLRVTEIAVWENGIRKVVNPSDLADREIVGVCGLGNPEAFKETIQTINGAIVGFHPFPDHHKFNLRDVDWLSKHYPHQFFLSTSKDMVKLLPLIKTNSTLAERWGEVVTATEITPYEQFVALLEVALKKN